MTAPSTFAQSIVDFTPLLIQLFFFRLQGAEKLTVRNTGLNVVGHGIDVVELGRFEKILSDPESDFLERVFSTNEQEGVGSGQDQSQRFAGKFSVKEAVVKAMGIGFDGTVDMRNIEALNNEVGAPFVRLSGDAADKAASLGIHKWIVSISHTGSLVIASVIAVSE